jgi:large subunit ribosomal protein L1
MNEKILKIVQTLKQEGKKRNFPQTFDVIVSLKELDMKKPESKIDESFPLPHGRGKEAHVVIFSDIIRANDAEVLTSTDINDLAKNKRAAKKLAKEADFLFGEPKVMPLVGKNLGTLLGPRGKVPKLLVGDVNKLIENHKRATRIRVKDAPIIHCIAGMDNMKDEHVVENIEAIIKFLEGRLPQGKANIAKIMLKLTMGKPVKLEVA